MMIEFENVTKLYGSVIGVNDISLNLGTGAFGLLGPNGSGKTTLINLIIGQLRPTLGRVHVLGENPWKRDRVLRRVGICPAVDVLYSNVSAFEWVRYLVELHGFTSADAVQRARDALKRVGMDTAMNRRMGSYSLGMRQRTKLAQSFAHDPDLLILDEPFNGLDPVGRHEMTEMLRSWIGDGKGLLIASHVLHEVEAISRSFMLVSGGRLLASGSPEEVLSMLADLPTEIRIRCDRPIDFAKSILDDGDIDSITFDDAGKTLTVATQRPLALYRTLPDRISSGGFQIHELHSSNESLQTLFTSLMSIHRGER